jgi:membrane associated rhomboid family serine protease
MAPAVPIDVLEPLSLVALLLAGLASLLLLRGSHDEGRLTDRLRRRFVLGVPWGTLIVVGGVLAVYVFLQGGGRPGGPVVVGFRSWGFTYPFGMLTAAFAHANSAHITGNLLGTLVFAPIAEYAWSHYPTQRGSHSFGGRWHNPFARIGLFVLGVVLVGLATSLFTPGALIGFSGVVFAFGGFAIVTRPLLTVGGLLAERVVRLGYRAVLDPVLFARASERFVSPGWADIAIQGHAQGLFIGMLVGFWVVRSRDEWPGYRRVWFATLVFAASKSLFAIYWYLSGSAYVLFRGVGTAAIVVLAIVVASALAERDRRLVDRIDLSRRELAVGVIVALVIAISLVAVPYNLADTGPGPAAADGVEVGDYTITYAEEVPNRYVSSVTVPYVRDSLTVNTSGVIVTSDRRNAWERVVPAGRLASAGCATVALGGAGWRETVVVERSGWSAVNGGSTYTVSVHHDGGTETQVFASDPVIVQATLNESRVRIRPTEEGYALDVARTDAPDVSGRLPEPGETTTIGGIIFNRTDGALRAAVDGTRVTIATRES